jgi:hypothetical protein
MVIVIPNPVIDNKCYKPHRYYIICTRKLKMVLTRQEKEKLIEDLYNQGKTYQQIAREARVSVRDIKPVLEKAEKEKEKELGAQEGKENSSKSHQLQKPSVASQAYRLFSEGKTPIEVAVELNIEEKEVTKYYREHWKLKGLYRLNQIYEDNKEDIAYIIRLRRKMKAAGIGTEQAVNLIKIANNGLPEVEQKYQKLRKVVSLLKSKRFNEYRSLRTLQDKITDSKRMLRWLRASCQEEEYKINQLQEERISLKRLVKLFKNNDEEYLKIKKTVKEEVSSVLSDGRGLLRLALYSLIESMRRDPEKYGSLIHYAKNSSSTAWYSDQYFRSHFGYDKYPHQFNSYDLFFKALESTLVEDANTLYEQLLKEQTATIISSYDSDWNSSLLPKSMVSNLRSQNRLDSGVHHNDTRAVK